MNNWRGRGMDYWRSRGMNNGFTERCSLAHCTVIRVSAATGRRAGGREGRRDMNDSTL